MCAHIHLLVHALIDFFFPPFFFFLFYEQVDKITEWKEEKQGNYVWENQKKKKKEQRDHLLEFTMEDWENNFFAEKFFRKLQSR